MNIRRMQMPSNTRGFILYTTLLFMVVLMLLALTEISMNVSQTRIAANATKTEIYFEQAEGALNQAINSLMSGTYTAQNFITNSNANGFYTVTPGSTPIWQTINWASGAGTITSFQGSSQTAARFIMEQLPSVIKPGQNMSANIKIYRITACALNSSNSVAVLLQSTIEIQS